MNILIKERYYITKHTNTSYTDLDEITPIEKKSLLKFISDDIKAKNEAYEKSKRAMSGE